MSLHVPLSEFTVLAGGRMSTNKNRISLGTGITSKTDTSNSSNKLNEQFEAELAKRMKQVKKVYEIKLKNLKPILL